MRNWEARGVGSVFLREKQSRKTLRSRVLESSRLHENIIEMKMKDSNDSQKLVRHHPLISFPNNIDVDNPWPDPWVFSLLSSDEELEDHVDEGS